MILKTYQKYLIKLFTSIFFKILFVFSALGIIMGVLEEINFFSEFDIRFYLPFFLVLINLPSLLYEIFPFIFLITSQFFFINLSDTGEFNTLKNKGLNNFEILKIISLIAFLSGIIIVVIFYNFSAILKFHYLDIKKEYTKDNKYLATVTENGLWIKDEVDGKINFINSPSFTLNTLYDVDIIQLDENFNFIQNIKSSKASIEKNQWILFNSKKIDKQNNIENIEKSTFFSNFNYQGISNLFSNLSSLTIWKLLTLKDNYNSLKYSTIEIDYHLQKIISYPFLITIITLLSSILMMNIKYQKPKLFIIVLGILFSVVIYYLNFLFGTLGKNEKIPLLMSIWIPIVVLTIISIIGLVRINEK